MTDAFSLFLAERGFTANKIWRLSVIAWVVFAILAEGAIYLSAAGKQDYIWLGLKLYFICVALPLLFSPVLWVVFGFALYIIGQFGGKKGFSWDDGIEEAKKYGIPTLNKGGYVLLVAIPIWFVAMGLLNTKGYEDWASLFLIITPTLVYLCVRRWPTGETFEAIVRWCFIAIAVIIVGVVVFNTINRLVTAPAVMEAREDAAQEEERLTKREQERYRLIKEALEHNKRHPDDLVRLTKEERDFYNGVQKRAADTPAAQVRSLISSASSAVTGEGSGTSTSASWLGKYWLLLVGVALVVILVIYLFRHRKPVTATVTVAASPAVRKMGFWDWVGVVISILTIAWVAWMIGPGKSETIDLQVRDRLTQTLNRPDFSTGQKVMWVVKGEQKRLTSVRLGGEIREVDVVQEIMIEGAMVGGCFKQPKKGTALGIHWATEKGQHELPFSPTVNLEVRFTACYVDSPFMRWLLDVIPTF